MREIRRILCPVDLSDTSRHAVTHAVHLAQWFSSSITALHVCNPIVIPATDFALIGTQPAPVLTESEIADARRQVEAFLAASAPLPVDVVIESGQAARKILDLAVSLPADLIVIGTHGRGGFQHLLLGSVTEKVLRQAACPVMTVPPQLLSTSQVPFKNILCPIDFSDASQAALELAASLAEKSGASLTVLHALEWPSEETGPFTTEYRRDVEHAAAAQLEHVLSNMAMTRPPATLVAPGKAYREILAAASARGADVIVMGVHGRNPLDLMLFGSTTNHVVRRATCPVLTVRA